MERPEYFSTHQVQSIYIILYFFNSKVHSSGQKNTKATNTLFIDTL